MKKRKITIISLIIACITSLSVAVGSVFAWFFNSKTYDFDVEGGVIASYYESGDGTIDSPYEIARPIQLYYFAWLQDLGFYNGKEGFADPPYYFRVSHDLDMKDFVIPPIGTSENPFIGVFDGENHVISNLKVSNDALTDSASENATIAQAQILGFFGKGSENYYEFGVKYFRLFMMLIWFNCLQPITSTFFTSIGKSFKGMFLSLTRQIIFYMPFLIILPIFLGIDGILFSGAIADLMAGITAILMVRAEFRTMDKLEAIHDFESLPKFYPKRR